MSLSAWTVGYTGTERHQSIAAAGYVGRYKISGCIAPSFGRVVADQTVLVMAQRPGQRLPHCQPPLDPGLTTAGVPLVSDAQAPPGGGLIGHRPSHAVGVQPVSVPRAGLPTFKHLGSLDGYRLDEDLVRRWCSYRRSP